MTTNAVAIKKSSLETMYKTLKKNVPKRSRAVTFAIATLKIEKTIL